MAIPRGGRLSRRYRTVFRCRHKGARRLDVTVTIQHDVHFIQPPILARVG